MERFELPTGSLASDDDTVPTTCGFSTTPTPAAEPDAVVPERASSVDGLLALGALTGSAVAGGLGYLVGWTGTAASIAALVGLDVGVLVGAGAGTVLARRQGRRLDCRGGLTVP